MNAGEMTYRPSSKERRQLRAKQQKEHFKNRLRARKEAKMLRQRLVAYGIGGCILAAATAAVTLVRHF
jgi:D-serine deaminase-like pyridoxal phosphate-dependent protein